MARTVLTDNGYGSWCGLCDTYVVSDVSLGDADRASWDHEDEQHGGLYDNGEGFYFEGEG